MIAKFNKFERVAGLFVAGAALGSIFALCAVAGSRGWFETRIPLETELSTADGVRVGTPVMIAGLRAGVVTEVELQDDNQVRVRFEISQRFMARIRNDSVVRALRPFIVGEKILDVTLGSPYAHKLASGERLKTEATTDVMDVLSGRALAPYMGLMAKMMDNMKLVADAIGDPQRSRSLVKLFDQISPLLQNVNRLARGATDAVEQINKKQQLATIVASLAEISDELRKALPAARERGPQLATDVAQIAHNMAALSEELQKALPLLQAAAPELPRASRRAMEALDETVVTLKALQKSFLLRGGAREAREEEAMAREAVKPAPDRVPSNDTKGRP